MNFKTFLTHLKNGNTLTPDANKIGMTNWKAAIKSANLPPSPLRKKYSKHGYLALGPIIPPSLISDLQKEFHSAIQDDAHSINPYEDPVLYKAYNHGGHEGKVSGYRQMPNTAKSMPSISKLWANDQFRNSIKEILGADFQEDGEVAWRNTHVPKDVYEKFEVTVNRFHFDGQYVDRMKIFIFLSDITLEDGPFQHFSKRYSRFLLLKGFKEEKRKESITSGLPQSILDSPYLIKHTGPVGHVLVCATSFCIHRAGEVMPGRYRDMLQLCVRPKVTAK